MTNLARNDRALEALRRLLLGMFSDLAEAGRGAAEAVAREILEAAEEIDGVLAERVGELPSTGDLTGEVPHTDILPLDRDLPGLDLLLAMVDPWIEVRALGRNSAGGVDMLVYDVKMADSCDYRCKRAASAAEKIIGEILQTLKRVIGGELEPGYVFYSGRPLKWSKFNFHSAATAAAAVESLVSRSVAAAKSGWRGDVIPRVPSPN